MAAPRKLPSDATLAAWREEGLTQQQIADRVLERTGIAVTRSTVASALSRAGLTDRLRYQDVIPWHPVAVQHNRHYALTMMRHLARQRRGEPLTDAQRARLSSWLRKLQREDASVTYVRNSIDGFYYVPRQTGDPWPASAAHLPAAAR